MKLSDNKKTYLKLAVEAPLPEPLTYYSEISHPRGSSLWVPLGKRTVNGVVLGTTNHVKGDFEIKPVGESHEERPLLPEPFLKWLEWLSKYYLHPIGLVTALAFPPLRKKSRKTKKKRPPVVPPTLPSQAPIYTEEQKKCIHNISKNSGFNVHLLYGVTGSGKTEVYLNLLEKTLSQGQSGIVIVPEISLTPQLVERFASRFSKQVAVIHSHLSGREKTEQWWAMINGDKKILIGTRSALFCPIKNLGIIVIDEEHEPSFKQDERLMYHARDAAIMLGQLNHCPVILGSATPSLETWKNAQDGKYHYHKIASRVSNRKLPHLQVIDMRHSKNTLHRQAKEAHHPFWMSPHLYKHLTETLNNGEQAALFLNRRGVAQTTICSSCGYVYECPNCVISLTLHKKKDLVCHYCDYVQALTESCTECQSLDIVPLGIGTERIEKELRKLFPQATIARADRDEIQDRRSLEELIKSMELGDIDLLVGTQMIAKGLDFPKLTLVGLVMADVGFNFPDFRSNERSFQLFTQMSGRAGRHSEKPGKVILQTYNPQHPSIKTVNDYNSFVTDEIKHRHEMDYPPFSKLASIRIQGIDLKKVTKICQVISYRGKELTQRHPNYSSIKILGPAPAPIAKLRNKFRYHFLIKSPHHNLLNQFCRQMLADQKWIPRTVRVSIDIDPIKML